MSLATVLQRLTAAKSAIASAITAKGGTVGASDGLEDFPAAIAGIPSGGGGLPQEYQQVEYIESVGGQRIETPFSLDTSPDNILTCKVDASFTAAGSVASIAVGISTGVGRWCGLTSNDSQHIALSSNEKLQTVSALDRNEFEVTFTKTEARLSCGNESVSRTVSGVGSPVPLSIFSIETYHCRMRLYGMKAYVYSNGVPYLASEFVPCYNKATGEIGLYDIKTFGFFANVGTGAFLKGEDVITAEEALSIITGGEDR